MKKLIVKITALGMLLMIPKINFSQHTINNKMETLRNKNTATVQTMFKAMAEKDIDTWISFWAEDGIQLIPYAPNGFPKSVKGKSTLYETYKQLLSGYGELNFTHIEIEALADPNQVMVKWGVDIELLRNDQNYQNELIGTFEFEEGKVVRLTEYFNPDNFATVIGNSNVKVIEDLLQVLREKNVEEMKNFFTEDAVYSNPFASDFFKVKVHHGGQTIADLFSVMPNLMETVEIFNVRTYSSGSSHVFTEFDIKFTFKNGYVYTNNQIVSKFEIQDGKIKSWTEFLEPTRQEAAFNQDNANGTEQDVAMIERFYNVQIDKDIDAFAEALHEDIILHTPYAPSSFASTTEGKQKVIDIWQGLFDNFGELLIKNINIKATSEPGLYFGTWEVDIETPTGSRYQSINIGTYRVEDGKIIEYIEYFNPLRFAKATGLDLSEDLK